MPLFPRPAQGLQATNFPIYIPAEKWATGFGDRWTLNSYTLLPTNWNDSAAANTLSAVNNGDWNSGADPAGSQVGCLSTASAQWFESPLVFGSLAHVHAFEERYGVVPTTLECEFYARFPVVSANESQTVIGLMRASDAAITNALTVAGVHSDGTNFLLRNNASTLTGPAIDTAVHKFHIYVAFNGNITWDVDDVAQAGTIATPTDIWAAGFGMNGLAARTNTVAVLGAELWYT